jgi:hypothetical protein
MKAGTLINEEKILKLHKFTAVRAPNTHEKTKLDEKYNGGYPYRNSLENSEKSWKKVKNRIIISVTTNKRTAAFFFITNLELFEHLYATTPNIQTGNSIKIFNPIIPQIITNPNNFLFPFR